MSTSPLSYQQLNSGPVELEGPNTETTPQGLNSALIKSIEAFAKKVEDEKKKYDDLVTLQKCYENSFNTPDAIDHHCKEAVKEVDELELLGKAIQQERNSLHNRLLETERSCRRHEIPIASETLQKFQKLILKSNHLIERPNDSFAGSEIDKLRNKFKQGIHPSCCCTIL